VIDERLVKECAEVEAPARWQSPPQPKKEAKPQGEPKQERVRTPEEQVKPVEVKPEKVTVQEEAPKPVKPEEPERELDEEDLFGAPAE